MLTIAKVNLDLHLIRKVVHGRATEGEAEEAKFAYERMAILAREAAVLIHGLPSERPKRKKRNRAYVE